MDENDAKYVFNGYTKVAYTQVPDEFFDHQMQALTLAEIKVLLYIFRRTFGFKKHQDYIAMSQFVDGICKRTGERLDHGSGLSSKGVRAGIDGLVEKGYICFQFYCPSCDRPVEPDEMAVELRSQTHTNKETGEVTTIPYTSTVVPRDCPGCGQSLYGREQRWFSLVMELPSREVVPQELGGVVPQELGGVVPQELGGLSLENKGRSSPGTTQETVYKKQEQETEDDFDLFPENGEPESSPRTIPAPVPWLAKHAENAEPWRSWGDGAVKPRNGVSREALQHVGWWLEENAGLAPAWGTKEVKGWVEGLEMLYRASGGDEGVLGEALKRLRKGRLTVGKPHSLVNTARAIAAEREQAKKGASYADVGGPGGGGGGRPGAGGAEAGREAGTTAEKIREALGDRLVVCR